MAQLGLAVGGAIIGAGIGFLIGGPSGALLGAQLGFTGGAILGAILFPVENESKIPADQNIRRLEWALSRATGYVGVSTFMGAGLAAQPKALKPILAELKTRGLIKKRPLTDYLAAISVGKVGGEILVDLAYSEDSAAEVDMNLVMTGNGRLVEVQGTAEQAPFSKNDLDDFLALGWSGIQNLINIQKELVGSLS